MTLVAAAGVACLSLGPGTFVAAATNDPSYALAPGEYELVVEGASKLKARPLRKGSLSLRKWNAEEQPPTGLYPLYGWTDVDLKDMGTPVGASDNPASQDPDNPGVLVFVAPPRYDAMFRSFKVRQASGAPVLLIGTLANRKATRQGGRDGGGVGLFVQGREGQCLHGQWASVGPSVGDIGRFKVCPRGLTQQDLSTTRKEPSK
jgi:hypothetical protein